MIPANVLITTRITVPSVRNKKLNSRKATAVLWKYIHTTIGFSKTYSTITIQFVQQMNTLFLINKTCINEYVSYTHIQQISDFISGDLTNTVNKYFETMFGRNDKDNDAMTFGLNIQTG